LSSNQITHFYSLKKNTDEMIRMMEVLAGEYHDRTKIYLSWDAASWHISEKLFERIDKRNAAIGGNGPWVETPPLPTRAHAVPQCDRGRFQRHGARHHSQQQLRIS
jgi:hypothetical protein